MQERMYLNDHWYYAKESDTEVVEVRVPHTNQETPLNYFDETTYQFVSTYSRNIHAEKEWAGKHVFLTFEGVAHIANVYVGDHLAGTHAGGYTAFTIDIAPYLFLGIDNTIVVEVDARESNNIPPFGNVIDYMTYGGIYRDVYLEVKELTYIQDVFVKPEVRMIEKIEEPTSNQEPAEESQEPKVTQVEERILGVEIQVAKPEDRTWDGLRAGLSLRKIGEEEWIELGETKLTESVCNLEYKIDDIGIEIETWEIDDPNLYQMKVEFIKDRLGGKGNKKTKKKVDEKSNHSGEEQLDKVLDSKIVKFGFRTCEFRKDGFYLNHKKIKLRGLNRHQSYPYVGYAMPKRPQQFDADILKYELGVNAVRTSHYPQSHYFMDRCDELGLLVFTELPGWQHIGDETWKDGALLMTEEMVMQYRNHPSIILWGARINESQDDDRLYRKSNKLIHGLDTTRQTGGVRFLKNSTLLEDVYTYNDFSHTGKNAGLEPKGKVTKNVEAPYLVTEYNGHMFPTKAFDSESHRLEHAKRHANVLEALYANEDITGGFGWCMFDYNTHKDFGSGDRICYHGVMNMFRIPKLAASVYASQNDQLDVLEISSAVDIGEHPGGNIEAVYAFTNGDCVNVYKNNEFIKTFYPDTKKYGHMPHPPILIDDFIGELLEKNEKYSHSNAETIKKVLRAIVKYGQYNLPIPYKLAMAKVMLLEKIKLADGMRLYSEYVGNWGGQATTYRFESIKDGEVVKAVEKSATRKALLRVTTDTDILQETSTYDVATVRIEIVNEMGEILPYYQGVLTLETVGCLELIGPKSVTAIGGSVGTYVKTNGRYGTAILNVRGDNLETVSIAYDILKRE